MISHTQRSRGTSHIVSLILLGLVGLLVAPAAAAAEEDAAERAGGERLYTFSWPFTPDDAMRPRGGTTRGPELTLAAGPTEAWQRLTAADLAPLERDRRAILAMAGGYRTTFDFIETVGFGDDYTPPRPYQSWATEYVYVIADEPRFISLQHILVMTFRQEDGSLSEPMVVKHWRQDWRFEDPELHVYAGHGQWERRHLPDEQVSGTWSQAVYQVDDSPRYQAIGRWHHRSNHASWISEETWRPLPRRESSVRDDYHVLAGTNRVTITPRGWVHEEDNLKVVLGGEDGRPPAPTYLAREAGLNRYRRIVDYDFSAGDRYWRRTAAFWAEVRAAWARIFERHDRFSLAEQADGAPLFAVMFELADRFAGEAFDAAAAREAIDETLGRYLED